ncbi:MAG: hypothetical protein ABIP30_11770 [Ferruginibacter sp.]
MKGKHLFLVITCIFVTQALFAQRVKRKGTTPLELNKNTTSSKNIYTLAQVQGKWQEFNRTFIATNEKAVFLDSLMIAINKSNAEVKEGMSMNMKGEAAIEDRNSLYVAGDRYSIVSVSDSQLVLNDGEFFKTMKQVPQFYLETVGKDSVVLAEYTVPKNVLMTDILGTWTVYKKEAKPGIINKDTYLVNTISVLKNSNQNLATGEIIMGQDNAQQKYPCTFILKDSTLQVLVDNKTLSFNTYKATDGEFVFGNKTEVLNYAKRK